MAHRSLLISLFVYTTLNLHAQTQASVHALTQRMDDCPLAFRDYAAKSGFQFVGVKHLERGIITVEEYLNADSLQIVKSYSPKQIIQCGGKGVRVAYVKGRKGYNPIVHREIQQMITEREGTPTDFSYLTYIEINNVPKDIAMQLRDGFIGDGAVESPGCFTTEYRKYYCTGSYTACFDAYDGKDHSTYSIRLYKNG